MQVLEAWLVWASAVIKDAEVTEHQLMLLEEAVGTLFQPWEAPQEVSREELRQVMQHESKHMTVGSPTLLLLYREIY